jgi:hypothetical protein
MRKRGKKKKRGVGPGGVVYVPLLLRDYKLG